MMVWNILKKIIHKSVKGFEKMKWFCDRCGRISKELTIGSGDVEYGMLCKKCWKKNKDGLE